MDEKYQTCPLTPTLMRKTFLNNQQEQQKVELTNLILMPHS